MALISIMKVALLSGTGDGAGVPIAFGLRFSTLALITIASLAAVLALGSHILVAKLAATLASRVLANTRNVVVHSFLNASWTSQSKQMEGELQHSGTALAPAVTILSGALVQAGVQTVTILVLLCSALMVAPIATLLIVALGAALTSCLRPLGRAIKSRSRETVAAATEFSEALSRLSATAIQVRAFGVRDQIETQFAESTHSAQTSQRRSLFAQYVGNTLNKDIAVILLVICVGTLALVGSGSGASVLSVITLVVRALASAQQLNTAANSVHAQSPALDLLLSRVAELENSQELVGTENIPHLRSIVFDDVSYSYDDSAYALREATFALHKGDSVAIIGPSGGGKSTLTQLLLRVRRPTLGAISVNGQPYENIDDRSWSDNIGFVPQDPQLIRGTIAENIRFYRQSSMSEIENAAISANIHQEIMRLPNSYATELGSFGSGLSGGQRQRIAIARALLKRPQILILDEPTSALDEVSEQAVISTLQEIRGKAIVIMVTHRQSTIAACTRLLHVDQGIVTEHSIEIPVIPT